MGAAFRSANPSILVPTARHESSWIMLISASVVVANSEEQA